MPVKKCKLPPYVVANPRLWFIMVEAAFTVHKVVKDEEHLALLLSVLSKLKSSISHLF